MGLSNVELYLVDDMKTANRMMDWLGNLDPDTVMGFDTETTGLDLYSPTSGLRMVQIGDENFGWAIPWHRWSGLAIEALDAWDGRFTAHNLAFDFRVMLQLANYRLPWDRFDDTMLMAQIADPDSPSALKAQTDKYIDPRASKGQKELDLAFKNNGWGWDTVPYNFESYWLYSALDPILASRLHKHYKFVPEKFGKVYDLEFSVRKICAEMEHSGMRIDTDYILDKYNEIEKEIASSEAWVEENWGINIGSNPQLVKFYQDLGAEFTVFTGSGAPSVNEDQLLKFQESDNPEVANSTQIIMEIRKLKKLNKSYFSNFMTMHNDGILHPNIKTMGAKTGRMSVTNPALQTLPSNDSLIRGAFVPRNDGDVLVSCDYSQMELRLMAHYSEDKNLIKAFNEADASGSDFFVEIGKIAYKDPDFKKSDPRRAAVKTLMYSSIYGAGIEKMAKSAGIPVSEMEQVAEEIFGAFPGIKGLMTKLEQEGLDTYARERLAYVTLESGRQIPTERRKEYKLLNYLLQGTGAEITKTSLLRLDASGLGDYLQMAIHDEIIFSIPKWDVERCLPIIEDCMSFMTEYRVALPAEPEVVEGNWGSKYAKAA